MKRSALAALLGSIAASSATAQMSQPSMYGIALLEPLQIAECGVDAKRLEAHRKAKARGGTLGALSSFPYELPASGVCYRRGEAVAGSGSPVSDETVTVWFSAGEQPVLARTGGIFATVIGGRVHGVHVLTYGRTTQNLALQQLTEKFGSPATSRSAPMQNGFGATFESIQATWLPSADVSVRLEGISGPLDNGRFDVETAQSLKKRVDALKALNIGTPM